MGPAPDSYASLEVTFLAPIPAIIAGALAIPVLIAYYLLKLRRRPVRVSSTLLWMQAVRDVQVNVPFRWLRPTWLFFLQLAVLLLLLLALARPAVHIQGEMPTKLILMIDRTASMSAVDDARSRETRLDLAKRAAMQHIDDLARSRGGSNLSVAVVAFAAEPVALTGFTTDRGRVRATIEAIRPTDQPGESVSDTAGTGGGLQAALDLAGAMLAGDVEEISPRERGQVVLFSDGVSTQRDGYNLAADFRFVYVGPETSERPDNLGIVALSARRDWEDPSTIRIFARVVNAGPEPVATSVALLVDDREVQRSAIEVPAHDPDDEAVSGEAGVAFALDLRDGGVITVRLLRDDVLLTDNRASIVIDPARRPRVLVVAPDPPPPTGASEEASPRLPGQGPEWLITELIRELRLPLRVTFASIYEREAEEQASPAADLVIFDRVRPRRLPPVATLSFGTALPTEAIVFATAPADDPGTYVLWWQRTHPILRHVALDSIFTARSLRMSVRPQAAESPQPRVTVQELARGSFGPLMLLIDDAGVPRIVIGFELMQSNWALHQGFPIFMTAAVDHLTLRGEAASGKAFTTAEPASIAVRAAASQLVLDGPQRLTLDLRPAAGGPAPSPTGPRQVNLGMIETAGVYRAATPDIIADPIPAIAVNLASDVESSLRGRQTIRVGGDVHTAQPGMAGPRELWHWFVFAALVLLCIEWMVHAARMRI